MVELYKHGKPRREIVREYELTASVLDKWLKRINATGSSHEKDNRMPEELELLKHRKENQQLRMENDVLKQAALIYARKVLRSEPMPTSTQYQRCAGA